MNNIANRNDLIEDHMPTVQAMAARMKTGLPTHIDTEELVSEGNLGLVEAAASFSPDHRTTFRTWARYRIRGRMLSFIRTSAQRQEEPLNEQ